MRSVVVVVVVVVAYMVGGLSYVGKRHFGRIVQERNLQEMWEEAMAFNKRDEVRYCCCCCCCCLYGGRIVLRGKETLRKNCSGEKFTRTVSIRVVH